MANTTFAQLKKNATKSFETLKEKADQLANEGGSGKDDRFWTLSVDQAGNGSAVIRFLPSPPNEDFPFVKYFDHLFKGPSGRWLAEMSLTTLGQQCPISEMNQELYNSGNPQDKAFVSGTQGNPGSKRRLNFVSNIYVIKDPANPDNEGKVFLFRYGKKIYEMIHSAMHPMEDDIKPFNPFDLWTGANFRLRARADSNYRSYEKSQFDSPAPLLDDDDKLEEIWRSSYSLQEIVSADKFKSYDDLKATLASVMRSPSANRQAAVPPVDDDDDDTTPPWENEGNNKSQKGPKRTSGKSSTLVSDDDDDVAFFRKIADAV